MSEAASLDTSPDTPAEALAALRADQADITGAEIRKFQHTLEFVAMNLVDPGEGATYTAFGGDTGMPLAGEGAPEVSEFAVADYAATLGLSTAAGQRYVGSVMEIRYRLPRLHAKVLVGELPVWRARQITEHTVILPKDGAAFVDRMLAPVAGTCSWAQVERLCEEALVRFDPEQAERNRLAAAERRRFDVQKEQVSFDGTVRVEGELDLADALDLDDAVSARAALLKRFGNAGPLDVRRAQAVGDLARADQPALDLPTTDEEAPEDAERPGPENGPKAGEPEVEERAPRASRDRRPGQPKAREVVLHVHLTDAAIRGGSGEIGRCGNTHSPISVEQIQQWCGTPDTQVTVKPVMDINEQIHCTGYEVSDRLREQTGLRDVTCVFPGCTRPAEACERDHIVPYDEGGETTTANIACLCRRHHRYKTHGGFSYRRIGPTAYEWTTPHGYTIIRDHTGTHPVEDP